MFKLLNQFKIVGDTKNLTKASELLGISQPTLTQNLARLEKSLGVNLIIRRNHGIELTDFGEDLYQNSAQMVKAYNRSLDSINKLKHNIKSEFHIGCGFNWSHTDYLDAIKKVAIAYDNLKFNFTNGESIALQQKLITNDYDMVMGSIPYRLVQNAEVTYLPVFKSSFAVYACKTHKLATLDEVLESDLEPYQWVSLRHVDELDIKEHPYNAFVNPDKVKFKSKSLTTAFRLMKETEYLLFLPTNFETVARQNGLVLLPTAIPAPKFESGIMFLKQNKLAEKIANEIIDCLSSNK